MNSFFSPYTHCLLMEMRSSVSALKEKGTLHRPLMKVEGLDSLKQQPREQQEMEAVWETD